jgi:adenylylsulfate kinase
MKNRNAKNGWAIWITGLPGSGKSTIAKNLLKRLLSLRITVELLSTDELRRIITPVLKYTEEEREVLYGFVAYTAERLTKNGINIIIDGTGNRRKYRDFCRNKINMRSQ